MSDTYLSPLSLLRPLGEFDLDPCTPRGMPWATARRMISRPADGLEADWGGQRVWLNPPYGAEAVHWLKKLADHGNGVALIFARTETAWFARQVWDRADGVLFLEGRVTFLNVQGRRCGFNSGAPSCLVAYGLSNLRALRFCGLVGAVVSGWRKA